MSKYHSMQKHTRKGIPAMSKLFLNCFAVRKLGGYSILVMFCGAPSNPSNHTVGNLVVILF